MNAIKEEQCYIQCDEYIKRPLDSVDRLYDQVIDLCARIGKVPVDAPDNAERVQRLLGQILERHGKEPQILSSLAALHEANRSYADLVNVLEWWTEIEVEPVARRRLFRWLGETCSGKLQDWRQALKWWHRTLELEPDDLSAMLAVADLYSELEEWEELLAMLRRISEAGIAAGRGAEFVKQVQRKIGQLEAEVTKRPEEAIEAWYRVVELDPEDVEALDTLDLLLTQTSRWEERIQVLEHKLKLAETATKDRVVSPRRRKTPLLPTDLKQRLIDTEIDLLSAALEKARFNQRMAADLLGLSYHQFRGKLRKFDIRSKPETA